MAVQTQIYPNLALLRHKPYVSRPSEPKARVRASSTRYGERRPGTHMWTAPGLQEVSSVAGRIACDHMSGLLTRSQMTAGQDGVRDASSKQSSGFERATGSHGVSRVLGSIDHAICSF